MVAYASVMGMRSGRFARVAGLVGAAALLGPGVARAEDSAEIPPTDPDVVARSRWPRRWRPSLGLEVHRGAGTALGLAGFALDMTPMPWFSITAGVGTSARGPQAAAMYRVRIDLAPATIGVGAGLSAGNFQSNDDDCVGPCGAVLKLPAITRTWSTAVFANLELDIEGRSDGGFLWRTYVGRGQVLNTGASTCSFTTADGLRPSACEGNAGVFYAGAALGHTIAFL